MSEQTATNEEAVTNEETAIKEQDFYIDGIWLRDTVQFQKCQWANKPQQDCGVVIGVDKNQEWMLDWWWEHYFKHNDYPVFFADFGMSERGIDYCKSKGEISSKIELENTPWFKKPFGCLHSPFKKAIWLDTDCEVRGNLKPIFDFINDKELAATIDRGMPKKWFEALPSDIRIFNSGTLVYNHGDPIIQKWALMTLLMLHLQPLEGKLKIPTGDQEIYALAVRQYGPERAKELPISMVRLRLEPDRVEYGDCIVKHWTGKPGKERIKQTMPRLSFQRKHFLTELVNSQGWTKGAELGVRDGKTYLHVLDNCPRLTLIGIDAWEPQPDNLGPEQWIPGEAGFTYDHEAYEKRVRERANKYGDRAVVWKGYTNQLVKQVDDESLDFVFIDADHSAEGVRRDIQDWTPKVKPGGWVIGHDINWPSVKQVVNEELPGWHAGPDHTWFICKKYIRKD